MTILKLINGDDFKRGFRYFATSPKNNNHYETKTITAAGIRVPCNRLP